METVRSIIAIDKTRSSLVTISSAELSPFEVSNFKPLLKLSKLKEREILWERRRREERKRELK